MSDTIAQIGQFLGSQSGQGAIGATAAGGGLLQNFLAQRQAANKQKFVQDLITDPAKFNALVAQTEKPLNAGLTADVARATDAYGAERGLGSSPAVMRDIYAQALGPLEQQQQQTAISSLLQRLGIYGAQPTMPAVDLTAIFKALQLAKPPTPTTPITGPINPLDMGPSGVTPGITNPLSMGQFPTPSVDVGDLSTGDLGIG